ncbi:MAG: hypothetical protein JWO86_6520 [Myxococcaceae bacterium]|nr:hypothetical protein [Myxococcaceae bacterium]
MPRAPLFVTLLFALPLSTSLACSVTTSSTDTSSASAADLRAGWRRSVVVTDREQGTYALGEHAVIEVSDVLTGPVDCFDSAGCNGPSKRQCQTPEDPNDSSLELAACAGDCTTTTKKLSTGRFEIDIVARAPGDARLLLHVRGPDGEVHEETHVVPFARATHLGVLRSAGGSPHGTGYAALPGASFTWCPLLDADGVRLLYANENLLLSVTGATLRESAADEQEPGGRCRTFVTEAPGVVDVTYTYANAGITRREKVRVISPAEVKSTELLQVGAPNVLGIRPPPSALALRNTPIEADVLEVAGAGALRAVTIDSCQRTPLTIVQRLTLVDGSFGLGPASTVSITPSDLASLFGAADSFEDGDGPVLNVSVDSSGQGEIHSDVGAAHASSSLTVTGNCVHPSRADAGGP